MEDAIVLLDVDGGVATVTLNRPAVLNALSTAVVERLTSIFQELDAQPGIRAAILTGTGERAFAAGADITEFTAMTDSAGGERLARRGHGLTQTIEAAHFPVIAAVNGFALGGGCELAMACDIRIASETAKFGQPEVNLGIPPGYGGTQRLPRLVGEGMALYLCCTGETIDAAEALRIGLVQRVVPPGELAAEARRIALSIAAKAPLAVTATKRAIVDGAALPLGEALALEAHHFGAGIATEDFREGTAAFLGKRKPAFAGR